TAQVAQKLANNDPTGVTVVPALSVNGGSLDLTNNSLIINYTGGSPISDVRNALASGFASGSWNGQGINSSAAAAINAIPGSHARALGFAEASALGITSFHGQTVGDASVVIGYTLSGDANLDGVVNAMDFNAVATAYGSSTPLWSSGDFNYDGVVDSSDFTALAQNFLQPFPDNSPAPILGALVPEPSLFGLLILPLARRR